MALLAVAGCLVSVTSSPASAEEAGESDLIDIEGIITLELLSLGLDLDLAVAGTVVVDATVAIGP